jgi:hypothetical protein
VEETDAQEIAYRALKVPRWLEPANRQTAAVRLVQGRMPPGRSWVQSEAAAQVVWHQVVDAAARGDFDPIIGGYAKQGVASSIVEDLCHAVHSECDSDNPRVFGLEDTNPMVRFLVDGMLEWIAAHPFGFNERDSASAPE